MPAASPSSPDFLAPRKRLEAEGVLRALHEFCDSQEAGTLFPSRSQWLNRLGTTEITLRWALDELQRQGRIVSRQGARAYVAQPQSIEPRHPSGQPDAEVGNQTIVAIARPDRAIFDSAVNSLCGHAESQGLELACQFVLQGEPSMPLAGDHPLGYILFSRKFHAFAQELQSAGHRVVLVGSSYPSETIYVPHVCDDQEFGGAAVVRHLIELGHEHLAFFAYDSLNPFETIRGLGNLRAINAGIMAGKQVRTSVLDTHEFDSWNADPNLAHAYFAMPGAPTALVAWNDHEAALLLSQLARAGIRVPQDVSLVGYDNLLEGRIVHPALTTIDPEMDRQLRAAVEILTRPTPLSGQHPVVVLPRLVERGSAIPLKQ